MIENDKQLAAALDYIAKWADALEGMRLHEAERNGGAFPTLTAGPINELPTNLQAVRAYVHDPSVKSASVEMSARRDRVGVV
jgi:hypothetical protein